MLYRNNLNGRDRAMRLAFAAALVFAGAVLLAGNRLSLVVIALGLYNAFTAFFGYCPSCGDIRGRLRPDETPSTPVVKP
jgi:hypothetical protein